MTPTEDTVVDNESESRTRLWDLIRDIHFAMLTTRHRNGQLQARPVTTQNSRLDEDASLWFFMSRHGEPVADLLADPIVSVVYADPGEDSYVSVSGTASMVDDSAKKQRLWSRHAQTWFPGGPNDPDLALVRVRIEHAEYWDMKASRLERLLHLAKSVISRKRPARLGEHGAVRMN
jgi:general stress protein 26